MPEGWNSYDSALLCEKKGSSAYFEFFQVFANIWPLLPDSKAFCNKNPCFFYVP